MLMVGLELRVCLLLPDDMQRWHYMTWSGSTKDGKFTGLHTFRPRLCSRAASGAHAPGCCQGW